MRGALARYGESLYVGVCSYLRGESDGLYFLPLESGHVRLRFAKRASATGHPILRIDPVGADGLARIKADAMRVEPTPARHAGSGRA